MEVSWKNRRKKVVRLPWARYFTRLACEGERGSLKVPPDERQGGRTDRERRRSMQAGPNRRQRAGLGLEQVFDNEELVSP